jgi:hypothetical protein
VKVNSREAVLRAQQSLQRARYVGDAGEHF